MTDRLFPLESPATVEDEAERVVRALYRKQAQSLFGFARRLGLSDEDASDAVQETMARLWRERLTYDSTSGQVLRTSDGGRSWTGRTAQGVPVPGSCTIESGVGSRAVMVCATDPDARSRVFLISSDGGTTWAVPDFATGGPAESPTPSESAQASPGTSTEVSPSPTSVSLWTSGPEQTFPGPEQTFMAYRAKAGDTLSKISARFAVPLNYLLAANPQIKNPNHIIVGQEIWIPWPGWTPPSS